MLFRLEFLTEIRMAAVILQRPSHGGLSLCSSNLVGRLTARQIRLMNNNTSLMDFKAVQEETGLSLLILALEG